jgi:O-antigen/teichoic acid export membrane protein
VKSLLDKVNAKLNAQGGFLKAVGLLAGSTAFAQGLTFLALPILTRLYSPNDFALLAIYTAIVGMGSVIACLRLEIAISLPKKDEDAATLFVLSLVFATLLTIIFSLILVIWPHELVRFFRAPELYDYLWMLPLGIWLTAIYAAVQNWATRKKYFSSIAQTKIAQSTIGSGTQICTGLLGFTPIGLLFGQLFLSGAGIWGLFKKAWQEDNKKFQLVSWKNMKTQLKEYEKFPKYSTFESFANTAAIQIPLILIAAMAIGPEAGYLLLASKVMSAPLGLIGRAISQVYLSRAAEEYRINNLGNFTANVVSSLTKIGIGPLIFIGFISPVVFPLVFGEEWQRAGELVLWMIPWMVLQFIASPISMCMHVRGWQRSMLVLTVFGLILRIGALYIAYNIDRNSLSEWYIFSGAVFYLICNIVFFRCSEINLRHISDIFTSTMPIVGIWSLAGLIISFIIGYL